MHVSFSAETLKRYRLMLRLTHLLGWRTCNQYIYIYIYNAMIWLRFSPTGPLDASMTILVRISSLPPAAGRVV